MQREEKELLLDIEYPPTGGWRIVDRADGKVVKNAVAGVGTGKERVEYAPVVEHKATGMLVTFTVRIPSEMCHRVTTPGQSFS